MKTLNIFIDESGDFGEYAFHAPYYIVVLVFHDKSMNISCNINHLNTKVRNSGLPEYTIHTGPLIRREKDYLNYSMYDRKRIFNILYNFTRTANITYHPIIVEKKNLEKELDLNISITKQLSAFLRDHFEALSQYDKIDIHYDYGQMELTKILVSVFNTVMSNVEFVKIEPADYKLFQAADMLCTLELLALKAKRKMLSNSEIAFFVSARDLDKSYLRAIRKKRFA